MKKIFPYILSVLVLLVAGSIFYFTSYQGKKFSVEDKLIAAAPSEINRVQLVKGGDTLVLEKMKGQWFLAPGDPAVNIRVTALLNALGRFEFMGQLPAYQADSIRPELQRKGLQVFLGKNGKARNAYYLYRPVVSSAVLMSRLDEELVYAIYMPGDEKALEKYFQVDAMYWRDKTIISLDPGQIKTVELRYPGHPEHSFRVKQSSDIIEFFLLKGDGAQKVNSTHPLALKRYLSYFNNVDFYRLAPDPLRDSLQEARAWARLTVHSREGNALLLNLYRKPAEQGTREKGAFAYDVNECYGIMPGIKEIYRIKYVEIDPLLKKPDYFIKP
jgi:hypothetical protein